MLRSVRGRLLWPAVNLPAAAAAVVAGPAAPGSGNVQGVRSVDDFLPVGNLRASYSDRFPSVSHRLVP